MGAAELEDGHRLLPVSEAPANPSTGYSRGPARKNLQAMSADLLRPFLGITGGDCPSFHASFPGKDIFRVREG